MAVLHLVIYRDHLDANVWVNRITPSRLILITQVLHSDNSSASFSSLSYFVQPTQPYYSANEIDSSTQRSRIFNPTKSNLLPSAVVSLTQRSRIYRLNEAYKLVKWRTWFHLLTKTGWQPITPYHIYWHWCEYRKSINDDVIDRYNDMLIKAISIWEGGRVIPPTMQEKLRHDVTTTTSRRSDSYVGTQFQEHPAHYQVSLISIFGDKKTKKGAILNAKALVLFSRYTKRSNE